MRGGLLSRVDAFQRGEHVVRALRALSGIFRQQTQDDLLEILWALVAELTVQFMLGYTPEEFSRTLGYIASGEIDVAPLITGEVGIAGVPEAFRTLASPDLHAKILVEPALG